MHAHTQICLHSHTHAGLKVGLGTDVAGGYSPSMLNCIRQTIIASKSKVMHVCVCVCVCMYVCESV
jgi:guanine deaminase